MRDSAGKVATDEAGRAMIWITPNGLSSLKEAVIAVGHETQHIKYVVAGAGTNEAAAEAFGRQFWESS